MLDEDRYFAGISSQNSRWVAPAFAAAPALKLPGTAAILFADGAGLYSHWMFDLLPKLEVLRRAGWSLNTIDHYVVNRYADRHERETLERFGIGPEKIVIGGGRVISADRMLFCSPLRYGFRTPRWLRDFIIRTFLPDQRPNPRGERLRLYISRAGARRRRVLNEDVVRIILEHRGFRTLQAEQHSVGDIAGLVNAAEQIVAPHGAGATNVVFAQPGTRLLETFGAHIAPEAWLMTSLVGGRHFLLAGKDESGRYPWHEDAYRGLSDFERNLTDYMIDPGDLERALDMLAAV
jgi:capsular polysaccharide biosynthesis protein